MSGLLDHPEKMTADWLAEKLGFAAAALTGFSYTPVGTGQVGDSYRLTLDWANGEGPATVIAKCSAADETSRETARNMNLYEIEPIGIATTPPMCRCARLTPISSAWMRATLAVL